jgi:hypothetical protein
VCQTLKNLWKDTTNITTMKITEKLAELYAFRRGRATTDLIFGMRHLIKNNWKYRKELVMIFIDYKKHLIA